MSSSLYDDAHDRVWAESDGILTNSKRNSVNYKLNNQCDYHLPKDHWTYKAERNRLSAVKLKELAAAIEAEIELEIDDEIDADLVDIDILLGR